MRKQRRAKRKARGHGHPVSFAATWLRTPRKHIRQVSSRCKAGKVPAMVARDVHGLSTLKASSAKVRAQAQFCPPRPQLSGQTRWHTGDSWAMPAATKKTGRFLAKHTSQADITHVTMRQTPDPAYRDQSKCLSHVSTAS